METNPFLQHLSNLAGELIRLTDASKKPILGFSPARPLLPDEQYLLDCFLSLAEVEGLIVQLNTASILLANFRNSPILERNHISRYEYIIYHIEGHLLRVTGVLDRLLIFVNNVLQIGLPDLKCKPHFMLVDQKNKKGKYAVKVEEVPGLFDPLVMLLRYVDVFRNDRNTIAHSKKIAYEDLRKIEMYNIVSQGPVDPRIQQYQFMFKQETDKKVIQYKKELQQTNREIKNLLTPIYKALKNRFDQTHKHLQCLKDQQSPQL